MITLDGCSCPSPGRRAARAALATGPPCSGLNAALAGNVVLVKLIPLSPPRAPIHRQTQIS